ncbi:MAG: hypothetical protein VXV82_03440, partial [Bacteroidota bacterium]|nr:hypothetical protein [Bacteroidota bacterium]
MGVNYFMYTGQSKAIPKSNMLIVGDSHPQHSLNPKYLHDAQNISQSAEPYVLTYWKLKKIVQLSMPDTLIVGLAPHNISQFNDLKFSNQRWAGEMFSRSYPIEEFSDISDKIDVDFTTFYKVLWKQTAFYPKSNHIPYVGRYENVEKSHITDIEDAVKRHYYQKGESLGVSDLALEYLDSIVSLAKANDITLIMVSNPVHEQYLNKIPDPIMQKFDELIEVYSDEYLVFDKTRSYYPDSLYLNADHLNESGAKRFTLEFIDYLKTIRE